MMRPKWNWNGNGDSRRRKSGPAVFEIGPNNSDTRIVLYQVVESLRLITCVDLLASNDVVQVTAQAMK